MPTDAVGALVTEVYAKGKVVGAVCHGSMGLVKAKDGGTRPSSNPNPNP